MLELPEAAVLAGQLNTVIPGKTVTNVIAGQSPHKFAWFSGNPAGYAGLLVGSTMGLAASHGGMVEIQAGGARLLFGDGVNLRYHQSPAEQPARHQLLVEFSDSTSLSASVAMYGGLWCYPEGSNDNPYYLAARDKPSPLGDSFSFEYFSGLFTPETENLPLKGFLATQQRIPGLGNGVLQDILFQARRHPKVKSATLGIEGRQVLFNAIKATLRDMAANDGRDTERDLFGSPGGYITRMSKNTTGKPCPTCGSLVQKQAYMGGSIYLCPACQQAPGTKF